MKKLKAKLASLKKEAQGIIDSANESNDGLFSEEQTARFSEIKESIASINSQLDSMKAMDDAIGDIEEPQERKSSESRGRIEIIRDAYEETNGFKSHHEFLTAVRGFASNPERADERLFRSATVGSDEAKISSDPDGGFLIPRGFYGNLMKLDGTALQTDTGAYTTKIPTGLNGVDIPARVDKNHTSSVTGGFTVGRGAETLAISTSKTSFEMVSLKPEELVGATYATEKLLKANPMAFSAIIQSSFNEEFISSLNGERINGTGTGMYEGIAESPALVTVAKDTSQTADTVTFTNIVNMYSRMYRPGQAVWMCNNDVLPQLMGLKDSAGNLIWLNNAKEGPAIGTLLGRPVLLDENCETLGDKGDVYFVNWTQYLEGTVGGMDMAESIHVRFLNNERCFKFVKYCDGKGWWTSALTPKKSSVTISPFVTLAARA